MTKNETRSEGLSSDALSKMSASSPIPCVCSGGGGSATALMANGGGGNGGSNGACYWAGGGGGGGGCNPSGNGQANSVTSAASGQANSVTSVLTSVSSAPAGEAFQGMRVGLKSSSGICFQRTQRTTLDP